MKAIHVFLLLGILLLTSCAARHKDEINGQFKDAVSAANKEAMRIGYDISKMNVSVDGENSAWKSYVSMASREGSFKKWLQPLQGHTYLAVYYSPTGLVMGGDLYVFVDRHTDKVITILVGQ